MSVYNIAVLCLFCILCHGQYIEQTIQARRSLELDEANIISFTKVPQYKRTPTSGIEPIELRFIAYGEEFEFIVHHNPKQSVFYRDAWVYVKSGDRIRNAYRAPEYLVYDSSQTSFFDEDTSARVIVSPKGRFTAIIKRGDSMYSIEHVSLHSLPEERKRELKSEYVIYKHSDLIGFQKEERTCGVESSISEDIDLTDEESELNKRMISSIPERWTDCHLFDSTNLTTVLMGAYVDHSFYLRMQSSEDNVMDILSAILSATNIVFYHQMNIVIFFNSINILDTPDPTTPININQGPTCTRTISELLVEFSNYTLHVYPSTMEGLWHLFTNCYPNGAVGIAYTNGLCYPFYETGVTSFEGGMWITFAHEIGHNFGASHTFQEGEGLTGGIMDYGNGKLDGIYQFHTLYSKNQMCSRIVYAQTEQDNCFYFYPDPVCGDGIVDFGEECDDNSICCDQSICKLRPGADCSKEECCDDNCMILPTTTWCRLPYPFNNGYCGLKDCSFPGSNIYGNAEYCGNITLAEPCYENAELDNNGVCRRGATFSTPLLVADGSRCIAGARNSYCHNGQCLCTPNNCSSSVVCGDEIDDGCGGIINCPCTTTSPDITTTAASATTGDTVTTGSISESSTTGNQDPSSTTGGSQGTTGSHTDSTTSDPIATGTTGSITGESQGTTGSGASSGSTTGSQSESTTGPVGTTNEVTGTTTGQNEVTGTTGGASSASTTGTIQTSTTSQESSTTGGNEGGGGVSSTTGAISTTGSNQSATTGDAVTSNGVTSDSEQESKNEDTGLFDFSDQTTVIAFSVSIAIIVLVILSVTIICIRKKRSSDVKFTGYF